MNDMLIHFRLRNNFTKQFIIQKISVILSSKLYQICLIRFHDMNNYDFIKNTIKLPQKMTTQLFL